LPLTGERELDRLVDALNAAGKRVGEERRRASAAERLAAVTATAQEGKQIKLNEKHIQSFMGAYNDMVKLYESANPDNGGRDDSKRCNHLCPDCDHTQK
jgi:hypothetical protein